VKTLLFLLSFLTLSLFASLLTNCNNDSAIIDNTVIEIPSPSPAETPPAEPILVWGSPFTVVNSSLYERLVRSCRRCGLKRVQKLNQGFVAYEKNYPFSSKDPKRCSNWNQRGYLQIEFLETKLPTSVIVTIQPKYSKSSISYWGEPFSIEAKATAINKNKGFQIIVSPSEGLGGTRSLYIQSQDATHLARKNFAVEVFYGKTASSDSSSMISQTLQLQTKKPITKVNFSCDQYTN